MAEIHGIPVIAYSGACLGGGLELAGAPRSRVTDDLNGIGLPEVRIAGSAQRYRADRCRTALGMILTGKATGRQA